MQSNQVYFKTWQYNCWIKAGYNNPFISLTKTVPCGTDRRLLPL